METQFKNEANCKKAEVRKEYHGITEIIRIICERFLTNKFGMLTTQQAMKFVTLFAS